MSYHPIPKEVLVAQAVNELFSDRRPFITGSHAYSTPHEKSDVDLVVRMDAGVCYQLGKLLGISKQAQNEDDPDAEYNRTSLRIGNLNLIICETDAEYDYWKEGTELLIKQKPVTRDFAIKFLDDLYSEKYA